MELLPVIVELLPLNVTVLLRSVSVPPLYFQFPFRLILKLPPLFVSNVPEFTTISPDIVTIFWRVTVLVPEMVTVPIVPGEGEAGNSLPVLIPEVLV